MLLISTAQSCIYELAFITFPWIYSFNCLSTNETSLRRLSKTIDLKNIDSFSIMKLTQSITMTIEFPVQWYSKHRPSEISGLRIISSITFKWNCRPNDMFSNKQSFPSGKISAAFDTARVLTSAQLNFITFAYFCSTKFGWTVVSWTRILPCTRASKLISDRSLKRDSNALPTPGSTWSSQPIKMEATVSKFYSINPKVINFYSKMVRGIALSCVCIQIIFPV